MGTHGIFSCVEHLGVTMETLIGRASNDAVTVGYNSGPNTVCMMCGYTGMDDRPRFKVTWHEMDCYKQLRVEMMTIAKRMKDDGEDK